MEPTLAQWVSAGFDVMCALIGVEYDAAVGDNAALQAECEETCALRWSTLKGAFVPPAGVEVGVDAKLADYEARVALQVEWATLCVNNPAGAAALDPARGIVDQSVLDLRLALQTVLLGRPDTGMTLGV